MRERLIELIANEPNSVDSIVSHADYLLANGVIVPPVKLGSRHKVYIPVKGTTVVYETKVYGIGVDEDGDMVINPEEYPEEVIAINGYNIGKTVFLTREEAERALKGGEE
jgi:autonomous glycyl radical cofactor GrcA